TLAPNIGRVFVSEEESFTVADIPGLIEGAHLGHGLGIRFLRHLARTRLLVYVIDVSGKPDDAFAAVQGEIGAFDPVLLERPALIALNKIDLVSRDDADAAARALGEKTGLKVFAISAEKRTGLKPLIAELARRLSAIDRQGAECRN
ncbi:MAG TPA: GTPase, partial [Candidatus Binataceae bacterium]|nr:GTPase [Candidatus Binataceae bacterium]